MDTCQGDSGGPLFIDNPCFDDSGFDCNSGSPLSSSDLTPKLVGLVSTLGKGCGGPTPGVYVEVAAYMDWICRRTDEAIAQNALPAAAKVQGCP